MKGDQTSANNNASATKIYRELTSLKRWPIKRSSFFPIYMILHQVTLKGGALSTRTMLVVRSVTPAVSQTVTDSFETAGIHLVARFGKMHAYNGVTLQYTCEGDSLFMG